MALLVFQPAASIRKIEERPGTELAATSCETFRAYRERLLHGARSNNATGGKPFDCEEVCIPETTALGCNRRQALNGSLGRPFRTGGSLFASPPGGQGGFEAGTCVDDGFCIHVGSSPHSAVMMVDEVPGATGEKCWRGKCVRHCGEFEIKYFRR